MRMLWELRLAVQEKLCEEFVPKPQKTNKRSERKNISSEGGCIDRRMTQNQDGRDGREDAAGAGGKGWARTGSLTREGKDHVSVILVSVI